MAEMYNPKMARYTGGNEARGEFLAFIDAHVFVGPNWLTTPHRLLTEVRPSDPS